GSLAVLAIKEIVFRPRGELILRSERARLPSRAFGSHQPSATGAAWHRGRALKKTAKCKQAGIAQAARKRTCREVRVAQSKHGGPLCPPRSGRRVKSTRPAERSTAAHHPQRRSDQRASSACSGQPGRNCRQAA